MSEDYVTVRNEYAVTVAGVDPALATAAYLILVSGIATPRGPGGQIVMDSDLWSADAREWQRKNERAHRSAVLRRRLETWMEEPDPACSRCGGTGTVQESVLHPTNPNFDGWRTTPCGCR